MTNQQKHRLAKLRREAQPSKKQAMPYRARWGYDMSCDICPNKATTVKYGRSGIRFDVCFTCDAKLSCGESLTDRWGFIFQLVDDKLQCIHPKHTKQEDSDE